MNLKVHSGHQLCKDGTEDGQAIGVEAWIRLAKQRYHVTAVCHVTSLFFPVIGSCRKTRDNDVYGGLGFCFRENDSKHLSSLTGHQHMYHVHHDGFYRLVVYIIVHGYKIVATERESVLIYIDITLAKQ
jgi:hypothetical protein